MSALTSLTQVPHELSLVAINLVTSVVQNIIAHCRSLNVDYTNLGPLLATMDSVLTAGSAYVPYQPTQLSPPATQRHRQLQSKSNHSTSLAHIAITNMVLPQLSSYVQLVSTEMVYGQRDVTAILNNFRFVVRAVPDSVSPWPARSLSLISPLSALELYSHVSPTVLVFSPAAIQSVTSNIGWKVGMILMNAENYLISSNSSSIEGILSNPVYLIMDKSSAASISSAGSLNISMVAPNNLLQSYPTTYSNQQYSMNCSRSQPSRSSFSCSGPPSASIVTGTCDGTFVGQQIVSCPAAGTMPMCALLVNGTVPLTSRMCSVISYSSERTECVCRVRADPLSAVQASKSSFASFEFATVSTQYMKPIPNVQYTVFPTQQPTTAAEGRNSLQEFGAAMWKYRAAVIVCSLLLVIVPLFLYFGPSQVQKWNTDTALRALRRNGVVWDLHTPNKDDCPPVDLDAADKLSSLSQAPDDSVLKYRTAIMSLFRKNNSYRHELQFAAATLPWKVLKLLQDPTVSLDTHSWNPLAPAEQSYLDSVMNTIRTENQALEKVLMNRFSESKEDFSFDLEMALHDSSVHVLDTILPAARKKGKALSAYRGNSLDASAPSVSHTKQMQIQTPPSPAAGTINADVTIYNSEFIGATSCKTPSNTFNFGHKSDSAERCVLSEELRAQGDHSAAETVSDPPGVSITLSYEDAFPERRLRFDGENLLRQIGLKPRGLQRGSLDTNKQLIPSGCDTPEDEDGNDLDDEFSGAANNDAERKDPGLSVRMSVDTHFTKYQQGSFPAQTLFLSPSKIDVSAQVPPSSGESSRQRRLRFDTSLVSDFSPIAPTERSVLSLRDHKNKSDEDHDEIADGHHFNRLSRWDIDMDSACLSPVSLPDDTLSQNDTFLDKSATRVLNINKMGKIGLKPHSRSRTVSSDHSY